MGGEKLSTIKNHKQLAYAQLVIPCQAQPPLMKVNTIKRGNFTFQNKLTAT